MKRAAPPRLTFPRGFTLTELAIVLVIVSLLLGGLLMSLSTQDEIRRRSETEQTLKDVREALTGYAAAYGRLPCPAAPNATGVESPVGGGTCTNPWDGLVPAVTLGIAPADSSGYAVDAWGNRIRYAVSRDPTDGTMATNAGGPWRNSFTTAGAMRSTAMPQLHPDLHVCASGPASGTLECPANSLSTSAVAVIFSLGKNGSAAGAGIDEAENVNGNRLFVFKEQTSGANEFDDAVTWLSANVLFNRLIAASQLP